MNLRDLVNKLDKINQLSEESDLTDFDTQRELSNKGQLPQGSPVASVGFDSSAEQDKQVSNTMQATSAKVRFAEKKSHLFGLLQKLRSIAGTSPQAAQQPTAPQAASTTPAQGSVFGPDGKITGMPPALKQPAATSLKESLVSSFGYKSQLNEEGPGWIAIGFAIWDAWTKIQELPTNMPNEQFRANVYKIVSEVVAVAGLSYVGAVIGGLLAGTITGGAGAIAGALAGGIAAPYFFGDSIEGLVDMIVDHLNPQGAAKTDADELPAEPEDATKTEPEEEITDNDINKIAVELQTKLKEKGFDLGPHGIDGLIGKDTIAAVQAYKEKINASSDLDAMTELLGITGMQESLSESEKLSLLRKRLMQINEARLPLPAWADDLLAKVGIASASRTLADSLGRHVKVPAKVNKKGIEVRPEQRFERVGNDYINDRGQKLSAEEIKKAGGVPTEPWKGAPAGSAYASPDGKLRWQKEADGKWYNIKSKGDKVEVKDQNTVAELERRSAQPYSSNNVPSDAPEITKAPASSAPGVATDVATAKSAKPPKPVSKNPKVNKGLTAAQRTGGKVKALLSNNKGKLLLAALALGGWYFRDEIGNLITKATGGSPDATQGASQTPADQTAPTQGASQTPAQGNQELQTLVRDIKLDINDLKLMTHPEIQGDIRNAINHAEQTLNLYAPNM